jgi:hypothetical protein
MYKSIITGSKKTNNIITYPDGKLYEDKKSDIV